MAQLEPHLHLNSPLLSSRRIELPAFDHPYHFHPEVEVTFVSESRGTCVVGDHVGAFQEGELYFLGANLPHVFRNTLPSERGAAAEVLHFSRDRMEGFFQGVVEMRGFSQLLERIGRGVIFDRRTSARSAPLLAEVREASGAKRLAAFFELMDVLIKAAPRSRALASVGYCPSPGSMGGSERIRRACDFILEEFRGEIPHKEMARRVQMVPAAFSRLFRRTTRKTFTRFVSEVRVGHACRLLRDSDRTVVDIAFDSGFTNLSNFNRRFRELMKMAPKDYRKAFCPLV